MMPSICILRLMATLTSRLYRCMSLSPAVGRKRSRQDEPEFVSESLAKAREAGVGFLYEDVKGTVKEDEPKPEELIPDLPENAAARDFLKKAPQRGLWMPLGTQVKVMQCFRCKAYGHRTGDRECPLLSAGNILLDAERQAREDPMASFVAKKTQNAEAQEKRRQQLTSLIADIRREQREKKERKKKAKKKHKKHHKSDRKARRKSRSSSSSDSSSTESDSEKHRSKR